jgi:cytoskeletal protein RodZ
MARGSFGERLKRERELREVTLAEITSATRIGPRFLEALENEDWDKLPGGVFNRGFVRAVARYLGLDEEALLGEYDLAHGGQVQQPPERPNDRIPAAPRWFPVVVLLGTLVLLAGLIAGGIYAWRRYSANRVEKQTLTTPLPAPARVDSVPGDSSTNPATTQGADSPAELSRPLLDLFVPLIALTHVRRFAGGTLIPNNPPCGENRRYPALEAFKVKAADSSVVLLELNRQSMSPLGAADVSGTITIGRKDLRQASGGNSQP